MKKWQAIALIAVFSLILTTIIYIYTKPQKYTSVIIDCSNMGLTRAMSPKVLNTGGKEIYPGNTLKNVDFKELIDGGVVAYETSVEKAKKHNLAGDNPIILKAKLVEGLLKSDPVIDDSDAVKLTDADNKEKFLQQRKVILVQ